MTSNHFYGVSRWNEHNNLVPIRIVYTSRNTWLKSLYQSKQVARKLKLLTYNKPRFPLGRMVIQFVFASASCSSEILALVRLAPHRFAPRRLALLR